MKLGTERDKYGVNGEHEPVGAMYTNNQFKGRVLEFIRLHEKSHKKLDRTVDLNQKAIWVAYGAFVLTLIILTYTGGI